MPTFSIQTLGCRANQADSERLRQILAGAGFEEVTPGQPADCAVVNTCTVTREADRKSRQVIRRAQRQASTVVATGCAVAERGGLRSLPGAALRLPPERREGILELLGAAACPSSALVDGETRQLRTRALLKVQEGCDQFCSFCIVPYVRGRSRSTPLPALVEQACRLEAQGYAEIVLTGIHLAVWGRDLPGEPDLADLLRDLLAATRGPRFRLSSIEPLRFPRRVLDLMVERPDRVCPHLHLALQHASDPILERMRRGYTIGEYDALVQEFVGRVDGACLTTDLMTGFPGETEEDFGRTLRYVRSTPFYRLHVFPYSPRAGTAAARFPETVPEAEKSRRTAELIALGERRRRAWMRSFRGTVRPVLVERPGTRPGEVIGTADNYLSVSLRGGVPLIGRVLPVLLGRARGDHLTGRLEGEEFRGVPGN